MLTKLNTQYGSTPPSTMGEMSIQERRRMLDILERGESEEDEYD